MWDLYLAYERELEMDTNFDPVGAALSTPGFQLLPPDPNTGQPQWSVTTLPPLRLVIVEGETHGDVFEQDLRVGAAGALDGSIAANVTVTRAAWVREP